MKEKIQTKGKKEFTRTPIIGVIGGAAALPEDTIIAKELGELLAENGYIVLTGGQTGIMEEASKGAFEKGGITVGILPGTDSSEANKYVKIPIVTAMSHARNAIIVRTADVVVAIGGGLGTLSEIALALKTGKPVIGINTWDVDERIIKTFDPQTTLDKIKEILNQ